MNDYQYLVCVGQKDDKNDRFPFRFRFFKKESHRFEIKTIGTENDRFVIRTFSSLTI